MLLAAQLGRAITIQQGSGSVVRARPALNGMAEVGGRVIEDHERIVDLCASELADVDAAQTAPKVQPFQA